MPFRQQFNKSSCRTSTHFYFLKNQLISTRQTINLFFIICIYVSTSLSAYSLIQTRSPLWDRRRTLVITTLQLFHYLKEVDKQSTCSQLLCGWMYSAISWRLYEQWVECKKQQFITIHLHKPLPESWIRYQERYKKGLRTQTGTH
jgi:hypothetical protein